ncbi:MAG: SMC-Scp complex subunit ScpB [Desulfurellaceae bacterium]|nr:SMC-Scp complex subunit ScpB [Desulfurellaceae bacterium]
MHSAELKTIAESLIFAAGDPVSLRRLSEVIGVTPAEVKPAISLLREEYQAANRGIVFAEVAGGYQFRTAPHHAEYVKTLLQEKPGRLSRAALETLAIIAYRQPITKLEIESVRGVTVDGVIHSLLTKQLIREMGRKDVPGRPWVYGTTPQFLELFGLNDLTDLPPLPDIHEPSLNPLADHALDGTPDSVRGGDDASGGERHAQTQNIPSRAAESQDSPSDDTNGQDTRPDSRPE